MALPVRKGYKGAPAKALLTSTTTTSDTSFAVDTVSGWSTVVPFYCVVDPGTSKEEKVKVTTISGVVLTVVRAQDDTSAQIHNESAAIYPVFTADEADEANLIASVMTTKGDVIGTDGSSINRLGVGTNTHVLQADSTATNGFKWGQIVEAGIADSAVTNAKLGPDAVTSAKILNNTIVLGDLATALQAFLVPVGTISAYAGATAPTGWLLCNGTSTSGYTALAALVGATTPDFQGYTLVGKSASAPFNGALLSKFGSTTSTAAHTHEVYHDHGNQDTGGDSAEHTHDILLASTPSGNLTTVAPSEGTGLIAQGSNTSAVTSSGRSAGHTHPVNILPNQVTSGDSSVTTAHGNVQPSALVNYIIKHD
jgi:microcystin-dependent protein